jgi:hypothetical protein
MTSVYKHNNKIIEVNNKIAISSDCCCDECNCECDPCVTITVTVGDIIISGNCTLEDPGSINSFTPLSTGGAYMFATCVGNGDWNITFEICYLDPVADCGAVAYGSATWNCASQSATITFFDSDSTPEGCVDLGQPSVSVTTGDC